jgi:outer membrane protein assembly factor BamB
MYSFALALLLVTRDADSAGDVWPQWRGPTGDSVTSARNLPTRWSRTENVVWKTPIPWGNSTPAIWHDAVFVTAQEDDERLLLFRLDRQTGKIVWQREVGQGKPRRQGAVGNGRFHDENNMASPSPVTDGKRVWAHFGNGDLACYDFNGEPIWSLNLAKRFGPYTIWWGHANSPVLAGDVIVSICLQDPKGGGKSYVVAHDKITGKEKWFVERDTGAKEEPADSYTTPLLYRHDGKYEVIVFGGNVLDAYEPATGQRLWHSHVFQGNRVISGPTLAGDTVFAVQGMRGPLFAVRAGGTGDVTTSQFRWKYIGATPDAACPVFAAGLVFLATNNGMAVCVDGETGRELWKERLGDQIRATPLVAGDRVYYFSREGKATIVEARREFKVLGRADLDEDIVASPAVAGSDLFVRTKQHVYRIGGNNK